MTFMHPDDYDIGENGAILPNDTGQVEPIPFDLRAHVDEARKRRRESFDCLGCGAEEPARLSADCTSCDQCEPSR